MQILLTASILGLVAIVANIWFFLQYRFERRALWLGCACIAYLIFSGGQGADEDLAQAEAMHAYSLSKGVSPAAILVENKSVSTEEN